MYETIFMPQSKTVWCIQNFPQCLNSVISLRNSQLFWRCIDINNIRYSFNHDNIWMNIADKYTNYHQCRWLTKWRDIYQFANQNLIATFIMRIRVMEGRLTTQRGSSVFVLALWIYIILFLQMRLNIKEIKWHTSPFGYWIVLFWDFYMSLSIL